MTQIVATVDVNLAGLNRFGAEVDAQLQSKKSGPVEKALKQWAVRYRSFAQERYDQFSKGGGDWPPLAPATLKRRRKGSGKTTRKKGGIVVDVKAAILRDLSILFAVLSATFTGKPGQLQQTIPYGVRVGYGGPHRHSDKSPATIADIASFHNEGAGRLPKRQIIIEPPGNVVTLMANDMQRAVDILSRQNT